LVDTELYFDQEEIKQIESASRMKNTNAGNENEDDGDGDDDDEDDENIASTFDELERCLQEIFDMFDGRGITVLQAIYKQVLDTTTALWQEGDWESRYIATVLWANALKVLKPVMVLSQAQVVFNTFFTQALRDEHAPVRMGGVIGVAIFAEVLVRAINQKWSSICVSYS